jgi:hypothetical protein
LSAVEDELLEQLALVANRPPPVVVVIRDVKGVGARPRTARDTV